MVRKFRTFAAIPNRSNVVTLRKYGKLGQYGSLSVNVPKAKGVAVEIVLEIQDQPTQLFTVPRDSWVRMMAEAAKASTDAK